MILIDIHVASIGESIDFRVDETVKISQVLSEILDETLTLWEYNITNGSKLLLV